MSDRWPAADLQSLRTAEQITVLRYAELLRHGLTVLPTGQEPHADVAVVTARQIADGDDLDDLERLVARLRGVEHTVRKNPHYTDPGEEN